MFVNTLGLIVVLCVVVVRGETPARNGPYRASGWKPDGPAFDLPTKSTDGLQSSYGPPIRTQPDRDYGVPAASSFVRPRETIETSEVEVLEPEAVRLETNYEHEHRDNHHYHRYIKQFVAPPPAVQRLIVSEKSVLDPDHVTHRHHYHHYHHYREPLAHYTHHHPHIVRYQLRV